MQVHHGNRIITLFSASFYGGCFNNASFIQVDRAPASSVTQIRIFQLEFDEIQMVLLDEMKKMELQDPKFSLGCDSESDGDDAEAEAELPPVSISCASDSASSSDVLPSKILNSTFSDDMLPPGILNSTISDDMMPSGPSGSKRARVSESESIPDDPDITVYPHPDEPTSPAPAPAQTSQ